MEKKRQVFLTIIFSVFTISSSHAELFYVTATRNSGGQVVQGSFNSAKKALDYMTGDGLNQAFGTNVNGEAITMALNYRGLNSSLSYDSGNNLTLNINGIISNKVFQGSSRDDAIDQVREFLKSGGGDILNRINKKLAAVSPSDPVAGNPISLMSQMAEHDFDLTFNDAKNSDSADGNVGVGAKFSHYNVSGINSNVISLTPFSYRKSLFDSDVKLLLKLPTLTAILTEGSAKTYQVSGAIGLAIPLYKKIWSISPLASIGAVGSEDQGSAGLMKGFGATNKFNFTFDKFSLAFGTMFGRYSTEPITIQGYKSDPGIANNVLKNTAVINFPIGVAQKYAAEFSLGNSRFYGTDLYIENMIEYGVGLVKTNAAKLDLKYFSYDSQRVATIGDGTKKVRGLMVGLKFQF